jgi:nucleotide-binding universal stress UspA family protein
MFRTIIVGYDGPGRGGEAIALAEALRDPRDGTLLLTTAFPPAPVPAGVFILPDDYREPTEAMLETARTELEGRLPVRTTAVGASPARALTEVAEHEHADLVVIGSSHHGPIGRVAPGATAERLLTGAPCAVAVAPRGYAGTDVRRLGVAYDGSPEAEAALRAAEALALERNAALTCYCVVEPPPVTRSVIAAGTGSEWPSVTAKEHARQLLYYVTDHRPRGLELETVLLHGHAAEQIARRTAGHVDVLFAGSRGYGPLHRALVGSVSGALVRDAGCPVVVMSRSALAHSRAANAPEAANA